MEVANSEVERRIEQSFYEARERQRKSTNLPKKSLDHTLLRSKKFFNQESGQKESPKFSPLNERHDAKNILMAESQSYSPSLATSFIEVYPRDRSNKQSEEYFKDRRFRSKLSIEQVSVTPKSIEFSPYKRPTSRRPRHNYLGKENMSQLNFLDFNDSLNKTHHSPLVELTDRNVYVTLELQNKQLKARQEVYKTEIKTLTDHLARERSYIINLKQSESDYLYKQQQLKDLNSKIEELTQANSKLKDEAVYLNSQYESIKQRDKGFQRIEDAIRKELKLSSMQHEDITIVLEQMLKKYRRYDSFVDNIVDMKIKITGDKQGGLKELWRWLKKVMQQISPVNDFLATLKTELRLPKQTKFQQVKLKVVKRLLRS